MRPLTSTVRPPTEVELSVAVPVNGLPAWFPVRPKLPLLPVPMALKLGWLNTFVASQRSWNLTFCQIANSFPPERVNSLIPGPVTGFLWAFPKAPEAGSEKAASLNQFCQLLPLEGVRLAPETRFGYCVDPPAWL